MKKKKAEPLPEVEMPDAAELPEGWLLTSVGEQFQIVGGGTPSTKKPEYWEGDIPWISSADIYGIKKIVPRRKINENALKNSAANLVPKGSIIVVTRVSLGRLAICETPISFSQDCHALIPKTDSVDPEFALYYLSRAVQSFKKDSRGTTISGVTVNVVSSLPFLLPPLAEQQRIVARVEALLTQVNAARDRLSRVPLIMKKFRQAVLAAACSGRLTEGWRGENASSISSEDFLKHALNFRRKYYTNKSNKKYKEPETPSDDFSFSLPSEWTWATLEQLSQFVTDGDHYPPKRVSKGIPHLTSKHVKKWKLSFDDCSYISPDDFEIVKVRYEPQEGDVILTCVGTIGETAIVPKDFTFSADRNLAAIRLFPEFFLPQMLQFILNSPPWENHIKTASGSTAQPHIYLKDLRAMAVPLPPLAEQHEIVRRVGLLFERADAIDREVAAAGRRCERLTQAVLGKAFAGRL